MIQKRSDAIMSSPKVRRGGQYGKGATNGQPQPAPQPTPQPQSGYAGLTGKALVQALVNDYLKLKPNQTKGDYTDNNNQDLITYQQKEDDKTANFLASTDKNVDYNDPQYADGYSYHDLDLNKLLLRLNVKEKPQVLNAKDFSDYLKQTGQKAVYRGWSGQNAIKRFKEAEHNHVGNGWNGDGYYFSPSKSIANGFANGVGNVTTMALSPTARVITSNRLHTLMQAESPKLQRALSHAGSGTGGWYGTNNGEAQFALKLGYNVVDMGGGYLYAVTRDAFVVKK